MVTRNVFLLITLLFFFASCHEKAELQLLAPHKKFIDDIRGSRNSFYSVSEPLKSQPKKDLAIGIFDSGIGGLTVFDAIINTDYFNASHENRPDGIKDFDKEQFVYFADQANMPYSNYVEEGKKDLLVENILKDALFLLNNKYHPSADSPQVADDKPNIKAMVIACNTGTAYGKKQVEELCRVTGSKIKVIGVIDAGCRGTMELIPKEDNAVIGVMATPATVSSMAYVNTLNELNKDHTRNIRIFQQGGKGLHEAIENKPQFIGTTYSRPYAAYEGPSLFDSRYPIDKSLLPYYRFDTTQCQMLYNKGTLEASDTIEINSIENYARYHVVSLVEQLRKDNDTVPLKAIILGCTHYPFASGIIGDVLRELRKTDRYGQLLADSVYIVDPALNTAKELYAWMSQHGLFNDTGKSNVRDSRFFISVPNTFEKEVETGPDGRFTQEYQYKKRGINEMKDFTLMVPFSPAILSGDQMDMIRNRLPSACRILEHYMNINEPDR